MQGGAQGSFLVSAHKTSLVYPPPTTGFTYLFPPTNLPKPCWRLQGLIVHSIQYDWGLLPMNSQHQGTTLLQIFRDLGRKSQTIPATKVHESTWNTNPNTWSIILGYSAESLVYLFGGFRANSHHLRAWQNWNRLRIEYIFSAYVFFTASWRMTWETLGASGALDKADLYMGMVLKYVSIWFSDILCV